jgi:hypothetical protein
MLLHQAKTISFSYFILSSISFHPSFCSIKLNLETYEHCLIHLVDSDSSPSSSFYTTDFIDTLLFLNQGMQAWTVTQLLLPLQGTVPKKETTRRVVVRHEERDERCSINLFLQFQLCSLRIMTEIFSNRQTSHLNSFILFLNAETSPMCTQSIIFPGLRTVPASIHYLYFTGTHVIVICDLPDFQPNMGKIGLPWLIILLSGNNFRMGQKLVFHLN